MKGMSNNQIIQNEAAKLAPATLHAIATAHHTPEQIAAIAAKAITIDENGNENGFADFGFLLLVLDFSFPDFNFFFLAGANVFQAFAFFFPDFVCSFCLPPFVAFVFIRSLGFLALPKIVQFSF